MNTVEKRVEQTVEEAGKMIGRPLLPEERTIVSLAYLRGYTDMLHRMETTMNRVLPR